MNQPENRLRHFFNQMTLMFIFMLSISLSIPLVSANESLPIISEVKLINDLGENLTKAELLEIIKTKAGDKLNSEVLLMDVNSLIEKRPEYQNIMTSVEPLDSGEVVVDQNGKILPWGNAKHLG